MEKAPELSLLLLKFSACTTPCSTLCFSILHLTSNSLYVFKAFDSKKYVWLELSSSRAGIIVHVGHYSILNV